MPSRRSNSPSLPRLQASASRTMRSFSAGPNTRRRPGGTTSVDGGTVLGFLDFGIADVVNGLGIEHGPFSALRLVHFDDVLSQGTLADRACMTCLPRNRHQSCCSAGVEVDRRERAWKVRGLSNRGMPSYRRQDRIGCFPLHLRLPSPFGRGAGGEAVDLPDASTRVAGTFVVEALAVNPATRPDVGLSVAKVSGQTVATALVARASSRSSSSARA